MPQLKNSIASVEPSTLGYFANKDHQMASTSLEQRVAALEEELAKLKSKLEGRDASKPWWERIAGTFQDDSVYEQAMKLGRQYRRSLKPRKSVRKKNQES
jgi:hypothetical protein